MVRVLVGGGYEDYEDDDRGAERVFTLQRCGWISLEMVLSCSSVEVVVVPSRS